MQYLKGSISVMTPNWNKLWLYKPFEMKHDCTDHTKQGYFEFLQVHCIWNKCKFGTMFLGLFKPLFLQFQFYKKKHHYHLQHLSLSPTFFCFFLTSFLHFKLILKRVQLDISGLSFWLNCSRFLLIFSLSLIQRKHLRFCLCCL